MTPKQQITYRPLTELKKLPNNPRTIKKEDMERLKTSLQQNPDYFEARPVILSNRTGELVIIAGNQRYEAAKALKMAEIPTVLLEGLTEEREREIIIRDNVANGEWDMDILANEWDLGDLEEWGVDLDWGDGPVIEAQEDEVPEVSEDEPVRSKTGEIYQLGRHRLMCGDSTNLEMIEKLMNGERADICFTSPPYNVGGWGKVTVVAEGKYSYLASNGAYSSYEDDLDDEEYSKFLSSILNNALSVSDDVFLNIGYTKGALKGTALFLGQNADKFAGVIHWAKTNAFPPMLPAQYGILTNKGEPIYMFNDFSRRKATHPQWNRNTPMPNIVETENAGQNSEASSHKATFPVALPAHFISNFTESSVLDVFGGTGTTLIAAEQLDRKCYMMELDQKYCDVIRKRYWKFVTGNEEGWEDGTKAE